MITFDLDIAPPPFGRGWIWLLALAATALVLGMALAPDADALVLGMALAPDADAKTYRSHAVTSAFQRTHPCPSTGRTSGACPGWIRDHIVPLCHGGADAVFNLAWQTTADAKRKDKIECR